MQAIEESVLDAVNSRTRQILAGLGGPVIFMAFSLLGVGDLIKSNFMHSL